MLTPEQQARVKIDALLEGAGWVIQNNKDFKRNAALGVAVREFRLTSWFSGDYLSMVWHKIQEFGNVLVNEEDN